MKKLKAVAIVMTFIFLFSACEQKPADNTAEPFEAPLDSDPKKETAEGLGKNVETQTAVTSTPVYETTEDSKIKPVEEIQKHIQGLTKNGARKWGTENEIAAAGYIKEQMEKHGYTVQIQSFPAYEFDVKAMASGGDYFNINPYNSKAIGEGHNVVAEIPSRQDTDKFLVLCAHYDTVSKELGIIDNTSGVVTLLELARQVSDLSLPFNLRFIFFSSEERFLLGSKYYVSNLTEKELNQIIACINVDMVGYIKGRELIVATPYFAESSEDPLAGKGNALTDEWHRIFPTLDTYIQIEASSDHFSFEKKEIPNMMITQKYFDIETVRKKDSDFNNLSITELENTIALIKEYMLNLDINAIYY